MSESVEWSDMTRNEGLGLCQTKGTRKRNQQVPGIDFGDPAFAIHLPVPRELLAAWDYAVNLVCREEGRGESM